MKVLIVDDSKAMRMIVMRTLRQAGIDPIAMLDNNDAYPALQAVDGLLMTGPTGTNVNDLTMLLCGAPAPRG